MPHSALLCPVFTCHVPAGQTHSDADHVFKESIASLHAAYFAQGPYQSWMVKSNVKVLDNQLKRFAKSRSLKVGRSVAAVGPQDGSSAAGLTGVQDAPEWVRQLAELSLYFLLWTEAANLRHTPELLWLLYHVMLSSGNYNKVRTHTASGDGPVSSRPVPSRSIAQQCQQAEIGNSRKPCAAVRFILLCASAAVVGMLGTWACWKLRMSPTRTLQGLCQQ